MALSLCAAPFPSGVSSRASRERVSGFLLVGTVGEPGGERGLFGGGGGFASGLATMASLALTGASRGISIGASAGASESASVSSHSNVTGWVDHSPSPKPDPVEY